MMRDERMRKVYVDDKTVVKAEKDKSSTTFALLNDHFQP